MDSTFESLEHRLLMSATAFMKGNQLRVLGDAVAGNTIQITQDLALGTTNVSVTTDDGNPAVNLSFTTRKIRSIRVEGGSAADEITIGTDAQVIKLNAYVVGKGGSDLITTSSGRDTIFGGPGADIITSGAGNDSVAGDAGEDELHGGSGDDTLRGGDGDDVLEGESGNDRLYGQDGEDSLHGGSGRDRFYVPWDTSDTDIEDFSHHERDSIFYIRERGPWPF